MQKSIVKKERQLGIEVTRILAAFLVIFNHTGDRGFFLFSLYDKQSPQFWVYLFASVFCKCSVVLFFMISGAVLLNRETSYADVWKKKVFRMALVLTAWSAFYFWGEDYKGYAGTMVKSFVLGLVGAEWNFSFWYLYAYIPFLMVIPILQKMAKSLQNKDYIYMCILAFFFMSVIPAGEFLVWEGHTQINKSFTLGWLVQNTLLYPLLGYFFFHRAVDFWNGKRLGLLWLVNILTIMISCYLTYRRACITGELSEGTSQTFHGTFACVNAVTIFATCQYLFRSGKLPEWTKKVITSVGGATFGIYLMHVALMRYFDRIHLMDTIYEVLPMNDMLSVCLYCGCVFVAGYLITVILKRIPIIKFLVS